MTELKQFKLPDVGEGLTEADIVKWHVQPGDRVTINQVIVEIETAKAVVELPSPFEGVVAGLLAAEGATVDVGTPILSVTTGEGGEPAAAGAPAGTAMPAGARPAETGTPAGGAARDRAESSAGAAPAGAAPAGAAVPAEAAEITAPRPPAEEAAASAGSRTGAAALPAADAVPGTQDSAAGEERQAVLVGYGVKLGRTTRRPRRKPGTAATAGVEAPATAPVPADGAGQAGSGAGQAAAGAEQAGGGAGARVLAKPPVRKLARDLGVDLGALTGSGPHGSITRADVEAARSAPVQVRGGEQRIPVKGVRKLTAENMVASAFTAPHVTEFLTVDVTRSVRALERLKTLPEWRDVRVSPLLLVAKAVLVALRRYPMVNSSWAGDTI